MWNRWPWAEQWPPSMPWEGGSRGEVQAQEGGWFPDGRMREFSLIATIF